MKGLDLSKFKKVAEDEKTATFQHDKGHKMIIAIKGLPKIQREQIKRIKLAGGTEAPLEAMNVGAAEDPNQPPVVVPPMRQAAPVAPVIPKNQPVPVLTNETGTPIPQAILQTGLAGLKGEREAQKAEAAANVAPAEEGIANSQVWNQKFIDNQNMINKRFQEYADWEKSHPFNENDYMENMGTGKKITTALGLLLGGAGAGVAGGTNPAEDYLKNQIERNIAGQKERLERKKSVWSAAKDLFQDNNVADKFARAHQQQMILDKADLIRKQLGTPYANAAYNKLASQMALATSKELQDAAVDYTNLAGSKTNMKNAPQEIEPAGGPAQGAQPAPEQQPSKESIDAAYMDIGINPEAPDKDVQLANKKYTLNDIMTTARRTDSNKGMSGNGKAFAGQIPAGATMSPKTKLPIYRILKPNADKILHSAVQQGGRRAREDYPQTNSQFIQAQQAEKLLNGKKGDGVGGIHDLLSSMYENIGAGSHGPAALGFHARQQIEGLQNIPYIGPGVVSASHMVPLSRAQEQYNRNKNTLITDIGTALKDILPPSEIDRVVKTNLPTYGDTPEDLRSKEEAIVNMIVKAMRGSNLSHYEMLE